MPISGFLKKTESKLNEELEFSVLRYFKPDRTLLKVLLNEDTQFVAELTAYSWYNWASDLINSKEIELLYHKLFTKNEIIGNISMREILHDAKPAETALSEFFKPNENSAYKGNYPTGINCGKVKFLYVDYTILSLIISDLAKENNISGEYIMTFTNHQRLDSKGRQSILIKLKMK